VVVTGHQINFAPGVSVVEKIRAADAVIWMDQAQYERHGFVNRNRLSDGHWLTVPVNEHDTYAPINRVRIADDTGRARGKIAKTLELRLGPAGAPFAAELRKPYRLLVGLNYQLIRILLDRLSIGTVHHFQSHLDAGHAVPAVSDDEASLLPMRERLAHMVAEIGGTVWLSGPSGRHYLDEAPFHDRGIAVRYFDHAGPNPSALELVRDRLQAAA
jgi:hypothetical protein